MQKSELIKQLEPFSDDTEIFISSEGLSEAYNIKEVKPLIANNPSYGIFLKIEDDEFPDMDALKEIAQYIKDYDDMQGNMEEILEELIDEIERQMAWGTVSGLFSKKSSDNPGS